MAHGWKASDLERDHSRFTGLATHSPVTLTLPLPTSALFVCVSFMSLSAEFIWDAEYCPFLISIHNLLVALRQWKREGEGMGDGDRKRPKH